MESCNGHRDGSGREIRSNSSHNSSGLQNYTKKPLYLKTNKQKPVVLKNCGIILLQKDKFAKKKKKVAKNADCRHLLLSDHHDLSVSLTHTPWNLQLPRN